MLIWVYSKSGGKIRVPEANFRNHIASEGVREQVCIDGSE
jgi:hypothetical protein